MRHTCHACQDSIETWRCETCRKDVAEYCPECHGEIRHGRIGPPPKVSIQRHPQQPVKFHEDEDMNRRADA